MTAVETSWYPGAHTSSDRAAVIMAGTGQAQTYGELDDRAQRTARLFRSLGLQTGDHVALWFENELGYPGLWWGAQYAGLYYTLVSSRLTPHEVAYIVEDSGATVLVVGWSLQAKWGSEVRNLLAPGVTVIVDDDAPTGLAARLDRPGPLLPSPRTAGSAMLYSSGTTGQPKGVKRKLTGRPLGSPGEAAVLALLFGLNADAVYLSPAPLYHSAPYGFVTAVHGLGGQAIIMERFDAEALLRAIETYRVTHVQVVPTMFSRLLRLPEDVRTRYDVSSLQCVVHAAAPCPVPIKRRMLDWWGPIIHEYYGGTEGVGLVYCPPQDWISHEGSVGRPLIGAVHIVDEFGQEVPPGVTGTIYFSGGPEFEYHRDAEKTRSAHLANGWATIGDIGHLDGDGFLYLTDRQSFVINVGGVNVYPQEAENVLGLHPAVEDVAVFGVPHDDLGEEVKAVVQPAVTATPGTVLESELLAWCQERLAAVKCPRSIEFRSELPREPTGKLLKRLLREEYWPPRVAS